MAIDPSSFYRYNVTDTCAVWNMLSSQILFSRALSAGCFFSITFFVNYECLFKHRKSIKEEEKILQERLQQQLEKTVFKICNLDIDDLQDIHVLEVRKNVSKGELSSIAFAKKTRQAFLTDDQKARKLASSVLENKMVQTTPHLFGWLYFTHRLGDNDKGKIIEEHEGFGRPLKIYFEEMYREALRCLSISNRIT